MLCIKLGSSIEMNQSIWIMWGHDSHFTSMIIHSANKIQSLDFTFDRVREILPLYLLSNWFKSCDAWMHFHDVFDTSFHVKFIDQITYLIDDPSSLKVNLFLPIYGIIESKLRVDVIEKWN